MTNAQEFRNVAEQNNAEEVMERGSQEFNVSEDDGSIFIEQFGLTAWWYLGQELSRREFNRDANRIIRSMGYTYNYNQTGTV